MEEHNVIVIGDLRLIEGKDICTNNIRSIEDFKDLNEKAPFGCKSIVARAKHWMVPIS
jgi:hypothetical protein